MDICHQQKCRTKYTLAYLRRGLYFPMWGLSHVSVDKVCPRDLGALHWLQGSRSLLGMGCVGEIFIACLVSAVGTKRAPRARFFLQIN